MADEKAKIVTDAAGPGSGPAPAQPEAGAQAPKQEQPAPEVPAPDKAEVPAQEAPTPQDKAADAPKEQKAASVSVFNFSEIMAEKKAAEKAATQQEATAPDKAAPASKSKETGQKREKPKEQEQPPKRRGRPPKEAEAAAPNKKEAPGKKGKAAQKPAPAKKAEKAPKAPKPAKGTPEVKTPAQPETPAAPAGAPRPAKDERIVYIKLSELHAFKNHPFQVRNDEEMKAMVSSVRDKGVTQPAIVRPREDGGYKMPPPDSSSPGSPSEAAVPAFHRTHSAVSPSVLQRESDCESVRPPGTHGREAEGTRRARRSAARCWMWRFVKTSTRCWRCRTVHAGEDPHQDAARARLRCLL